MVFAWSTSRPQQRQDTFADAQPDSGQWVHESVGTAVVVLPTTCDGAVYEDEGSVVGCYFPCLAARIRHTSSTTTFVSARCVVFLFPQHLSASRRCHSASSCRFAEEASTLLVCRGVPGKIGKTLILESALRILVFLLYRKHSGQGAEVVLDRPVAWEGVTKCISERSRRQTRVHGCGERGACVVHQH